MKSNRLLFTILFLGLIMMSCKQSAEAEAVLMDAIKKAPE